MRTSVKVALFAGILILVLMYSILIAYAFEVKSANYQSYQYTVNSLLSRRDELAAANNQLESKKAELRLELLAAENSKQKQDLINQINSAQFAAATAPVVKPATTVKTPTQTTQTIQNVPVTTTTQTTTPATVKKAKTRAS